MFSSVLEPVFWMRTKIKFVRSTSAPIVALCADTFVAFIKSACVLLSSAASATANVPRRPPIFFR